MEAENYVYHGGKIHQFKKRQSEKCEKCSLLSTYCPDIAKCCVENRADKKNGNFFETGFKPTKETNGNYQVWILNKRRLHLNLTTLKIESK